MFAIEATLYHYDDLAPLYANSESITRKKELEQIKILKKVYKKSTKYIAIKIFNLTWPGPFRLCKPLRLRVIGYVQLMMHMLSTDGQMIGYV